MDNSATPAEVGSSEELGSNEPTWRCFHCDEVFTTVVDAAFHFGYADLEKPACLVDAVELRNMQLELRRHREEDTDLHRALYAKDSEMHQAVRRAEEEGYAKGLAALKAGWKFERIDGGISITHASGMGVFVREKAQGAREIPEEVLHALALDLGA